MNLKEEFAQKSAELKSLETRISEGEVEAIEQGETLAKEIEELGEKMKKAEKASQIINSIGSIKEEKEMENYNLDELKTVKGSRSFAFKAASDVATAPTVNVTSDKVIDAQRVRSIRDIIGAEKISGNSLTYFVMGATEGAPAVTAQGAKKGQFHVGYSPVTEALAKIAGFMKETDELLTDAAYLDSAIRNRGIFAEEKAVEDYIVAKLKATSGVQQGQSSIDFDNILNAKQLIRTATGYAADAIVINPADLETLLKSKDTNGQYVLGGPAYGAYGNGAYVSNPKVWGLEVIESESVPVGGAIVGAFAIGTSLVTKDGEGLRVEVSNSDVDDFECNRVTVRVEERVLLATRMPAAFCIVGTV